MALRAFTTFFATISPVDVAALYAALTASATESRRRSMAIKGTLIATGILLVFAVLGASLLNWLGITLPALRTAGGILLLLLSIDMVFSPPSRMSSATPAETHEAEEKQDISVFPVASPLIAGPASLGAAILLMSEAKPNLALEFIVIAMLFLVLAITLALLLIAARLQRYLGVTGQNVISRVIGILLAALAVQFIFDGIRGSGLV
jgi:multiple antibiotic resistance protein